MPLYEYQCDKCGYRDEYLESDSMNSALHQHCNQFMSRLISAPRIHQTGYNPYDARASRGKGRY